MLFFDEETLLPNFQMWRDFSTIHKNYAQKHGIPFLSACSTIDDGYGVFGVYAVTESDQNHEGKVYFILFFSSFSFFSFFFLFFFSFFFSSPNSFSKYR